MLIQATHLIGTIVGALDTQTRVGVVRRLIIDNETGHVLAFGVKPDGWFTREHFVATNDVAEFDKEALIVDEIEDLVEVQELVRVVDALRKHTPVLNQAAQTQSGTSLGHIDDLLLETETWTIVKYYLKRMMTERILPADQVHTITEKAVVFLDQVEDPTTPAVTTEAATA